MSNFTDKKESLISVSVSRCLPSDHVYYGPFSELIPFRDSGAHICQPDATRVSSDYYKR